MTKRNEVKDLTWITANPNGEQRCNFCRNEFHSKKVIVAEIGIWFIPYKPVVMLCEWCYINQILLMDNVEVKKIHYKGEDIELDI